MTAALSGRRHQEAAPTVISLLRSVLSACRGGSFRFARHALASCHFSPRTLRAMEKRGDSSPRLAVYRRASPWALPHLCVCNLWSQAPIAGRADPAPVFSLGCRQARGRSWPALFLMVVKYRRHNSSLFSALPSAIPRGNGFDSQKWLPMAYRSIDHVSTNRTRVVPMSVRAL